MVAVHYGNIGRHQSQHLLEGLRLILWAQGASSRLNSRYKYFQVSFGLIYTKDILKSAPELLKILTLVQSPYVSQSAVLGCSLLNEAVIKRCLDNEPIVILDSPQFSSDWFHARLLWRDSAMMRYDARWVTWQYLDHYLSTSRTSLCTTIGGVSFDISALIDQTLITLNWSDSCADLRKL